MVAKIVGVSGNLGRPSKTRALVETIVGRAAGRLEGRGVVFDVSELAPGFGGATEIEDLAPAARGALAEIIAADALVVASPVYKGSYTGLFKHLFDLIPPEGLAGKPVLLAATGGGDRHALVIEHQLRPLFGFFEAATLPTGVYASGRDFEDGEPTAPALLERIARAVDQLANHVASRAPAPLRLNGGGLHAAAAAATSPAI